MCADWLKIVFVYISTETQNLHELLMYTVMIVQAKRINLHFDDQSKQIVFFFVCGDI